MTEGHFEHPAPAISGDVADRWSSPLPQARAHAREALGALTGSMEAFQVEAARNDAPWVSHVTKSRYGDHCAGRLVDALATGDEAIEELVSIANRLGGDDAPVNPNTVSAMGSFTSALEKLVTRHDEASLAPLLDGATEEQIETYRAEVAHRDGLREAFADSPTWIEAGDRDRRSATRSAAAAANELRKDFSVDSIEDAQRILQDLTASEPDMSARLRRLTMMATRLDAQDAILGDMKAVCLAAEKASRLDPEMLTLARELRDDSAAAIAAAASQANKINHAGDLIDRQCGTAWRSADLRRLKMAGQILMAPDDGRRKSVMSWCNEIGVVRTPLEALTAIVKTRGAMLSYQDNESLRRAFPRGFKGLETDFGKLEHALELRKEIRASLNGCPLADAFMVALSTRSEEALAALLGYAALQRDIDAFDLEAGVRLRDVRLLHETRKDHLRALVAQVGSLPVQDGDRTCAEARRLGRILAEIEASEQRLEGDPVRLASPAHSIERLLAAIEWQDALSRLLPVAALPRRDEQSAELLILVRHAIAALGRWRVAVATVQSLLGGDALSIDNVNFVDARNAVSSALEAHELIELRRQSLLLLSQAREIGLSDFLSVAMRSWPPAEWDLRLTQAYEDLDQQALEAEIAQELLAAASAAEVFQDNEDDAGPVLVEYQEASSTLAVAWVDETVDPLVLDLEGREAA